MLMPLIIMLSVTIKSLMLNVFKLNVVAPQVQRPFKNLFYSFSHYGEVVKKTIIVFGAMTFCIMTLRIDFCNIGLSLMSI